MFAGLEKLFGTDLTGSKSHALAEHYLQTGVLLSERLAATQGLIPLTGELKDAARLFTEEDFEFTSIGELRRPEHLPLLDMLLTQTSLFTETGMISLKSVRDMNLSDGMSISYWCLTLLICCLSNSYKDLNKQELLIQMMRGPETRLKNNHWTCALQLHRG